MHVACLSPCKTKPRVRGCKEPVPHPDGCIAPRRRVASWVSQPLHVAAKEMALQIATGAGRMWLLRARRLHRCRCLQDQVPKWKWSPAGGPGRSKPFPRPGLPARSQCASHGSSERRLCHHTGAVPWGLCVPQHSWDGELFCS